MQGYFMLDQTKIKLFKLWEGLIILSIVCTILNLAVRSCVACTYVYRQIQINWLLQPPLVWLSVRLSVCLSVCQLACLQPACLPVCCLPACLSVCLFTCLSDTVCLSPLTTAIYISAPTKPCLFARAVSRVYRLCSRVQRFCKFLRKFNIHRLE